MKNIRVLLILIAMMVPSLAFGKELPKIAVWDLIPRNTPATHAEELTSILVSEIAKLKKYEVYSQENVRVLAGWTAERMKFGCTDTQCLIALGQMDIAKLVSGSVGKIGSRYSVSLNLFDTQNAKAENAVSEFCKSEDELIELIQQAVRKLLGASIEMQAAESKTLPPKEKSFDGFQEKCAAPQWKIGDQWTYKRADGKTLTEKVVAIEKDVYVLDTGRKDFWGFEKNTMMVKWLISPNDTWKAFTGWPGKVFNFPLYVGKTWVEKFEGKVAGGTKKGQYVTEFSVKGVETISTPVGSYKSYRIHLLQTNKTSGTSGWVNWWYSPEIKNHVRRQIGGERYWARAEWVRDQELVAYEVK